MESEGHFRVVDRSIPLQRAIPVIAMTEKDDSGRAQPAMSGDCSRRMDAWITLSLRRRLDGDWPGGWDWDWCSC
ncbi:protein of unknown function [Thauera humireducens]|nr:protein of unknown function [Thauera humireducens]